jgi:hypothetical protein
VFEFFIPTHFSSDSLLITYMGYRNFSAAISTLESGRDFYLEEATITLKEVVVDGRELSAKDIVRKALENIEQNYAVTPFILRGFYRSTLMRDDKYLSVLEAALKIHDPGYAALPKHFSGIQEQIEVEAIRKTPEIDLKDLNGSHDANMLKEMLAINNVKYRNVVFDGRPHWKYTLDTLTVYNNHPVYVIRSGTNWTFKLYIDTETFAVYKVAVDVRDFKPWNPVKVSDSVNRQLTRFVKTVEFRTVNNKLYLNYINYREELVYTSAITKKPLYTAVFHQDVSVNEVMPSSIPNAAKLLDNYKPLDDQVTPYDAEFWKSYNIIKELRGKEKVRWE